MQSFVISFFFFFNDPATTEIYTLSLHDALPISRPGGDVPRPPRRRQDLPHPGARDRKSTRLNSSHLVTSYAVFCLKKKIRSFWRTQSTMGCADVEISGPSSLTNGLSMFSFSFLDIATDPPPCFYSFFFNDTATTEIYTLSLHDALPI